MSKSDVYFVTHWTMPGTMPPPFCPGVLGIAAEKLQYVLGRRVWTEPERNEPVRLLERRIVHRIPVPYLVGEAWFAGAAI